MASFRVLGTLELRADDGGLVALGGPRQRAVLATLLLHRNEVVPVDRLVALVWGEEPPPTAEATLRSYISRLRGVLADAQAGGIERAGAGYRLTIDPDELDLARFESEVDRGREALDGGDTGRAADVLQDALGRWRGTPLTDVGDAPISEEGPRLAGLHLTALESRIEADLACGRHTALVPELEMLVGRHPYREGLRGQLMLALYRAGRQADALAQYDVLRDLLGEELGLDPSAHLRDLHARMLRQDPSLEAGGRRAVRPHDSDLPSLVLVDDHPLWRNTLRRIVERRGVGRIVAEVEDGAEAITTVNDVDPDLVVMDIDLPTLDGIEATARLTDGRPELKVLVLSAASDDATVVRAIEAGACGYVIKTAGAEEVADAIERVRAGQLVFPSGVAAAMRRALGGRHSGNGSEVSA